MARSRLALTAGAVETQMEIGDPAPGVDVDFAAAHQHLSKLVAPTLDAGLHARHGDAGPLRRIGLGQAFERRQFEGRSVRFGEAPDHAGQTRGECRLGRIVWRDGDHIGLRFETDEASVAARQSLKARDAEIARLRAALVAGPGEAMH